MMQEITEFSKAINFQQLLISAEHSLQVVCKRDNGFVTSLTNYDNYLEQIATGLCLLSPLQTY
jgi:hypothetical protein